jgi:hypothetical protein
MAAPCGGHDDLADVEELTSSTGAREAIAGSVAGPGCRIGVRRLRDGGS